LFLWPLSGLFFRSQQADWPDAAAGLREGVEECSTINRLGLPPSLHRCLATTNII